MNQDNESPIYKDIKYTPFDDENHAKRVIKNFLVRKGDLPFQYYLHPSIIHKHARFTITVESGEQLRLCALWRFSRRKKTTNPKDTMFFIESEGENWKITVHKKRVHMRFKDAIPGSPNYGSLMEYEIDTESQFDKPFLRIAFPSDGFFETPEKIDNERRGVYIIQPKGGLSIILLFFMFDGQIDVKKLPKIKEFTPYACSFDGNNRTLGIYVTEGTISEDIKSKIMLEIAHLLDKKNIIRAVCPVRDGSNAALVVDIGSVRKYFL